MEVSVDPNYRRLRIGQRLYDARKQLSQSLDLIGIVFGRTMPGLYRRNKSLGSAHAYVEAVKHKEIRDDVIRFHLSNELEVIGLIRDYDPFDRQSLGYATHMFWRNPLYVEDQGRKRNATALDTKDTVRVATVQFQMRGIKTKAEFE